VRCREGRLRLFFVKQHRDRSASLHGEGGADVMYARGTPDHFSPPVAIVTLTGLLSRPALLGPSGAGLDRLRGAGRAEGTAAGAPT